MASYELYVYILCSIQLLGINAYPINIPYIFASGIDAKIKKNDLQFPQVDADVIELEHLKQTEENQDSLKNHKENENNRKETEPMEIPFNRDVLLPELERQLESVTPSMVLTTMAPITKATEPMTEHRPPTLPHHDGGKTAAGLNQLLVGSDNAGADVNPSSSIIAKPFYGAARLAFGQNPEVLPTIATSSVTPTPVVSTTTVIPSNIPKNAEMSPEPHVTMTQSTSNSVASPDLVIPTASGGHLPSQPFLSQLNLQKHSSDENKNINDDNKEIVGDVVVDDTKKTASRRSAMSMSPKTAQELLRHHDGQYSSFDMAQYVFWTGDEAGVARAVEEFIQQGLMSREKALKFLRDIRLGIEYLQRSYDNRAFPSEIRKNNIKKSYLPVTAAPTTAQRTTTSSTTTTTTTPIPEVFAETENLDLVPLKSQNLNLNVDLARTLDIAMTNKLQNLNKFGRQDLSDYDDATGRAKITEYIYTEYTLEELLYKLAKVMFLQSLSQGSDEAQKELQKLTDFLEREGNLGVIPIDLQKKVLHVLLTALSDTLKEHPELLPAARVNLAHPYNRLPLHTYGAIN